MNKRRIYISLMTVLAVLTGGCAGNRTADSTGQGGGEGIFISGSSTVEPISAQNAENFSDLNPDVAIRVEGPGTGDGFEIFCSGDSDIADASRPIKAEEVEKCEEAGVEFIELKVAIDGLSVITNPGNQVECLSFADLYALLGPESTGFDNWSDADALAGELAGLDASEFGELNSPYPSLDLTVTAPGEESGTFDSFVELVIEDIADERGQEPEPRPDYQASPNDNVIIDGIRGSAGSLGWVGFAFVQGNPDAVKALQVDGGDGCVTPTPETIASGEFPIARPLYIYVNAGSAESNSQLSEFVDYYLSEEGMATVAEVGYVPLEDAVIEETRQVWTDRRTGAIDGGN
ncbi:MAG: phosphate ABC transporter substrate-binding protein PstS family protein [Actinobacteria bacterium]|nr:phosphate ABC transporter substrate-binding protein PstS family protein [Actinomycetota bacterium]